MYKSILLLLLPLFLTAMCGVSAATAHLPPPAEPTAPVLESFVKRGVLAGTVTLVAGPTRILDVEAVGDADIAAHKPMRADALFWIASQTKSFTATALMVLVDEGKLHLDDPVAKYLPEFKGLWLTVEKDENYLLLHRPQHPITIRQLLSHTSGLCHFSALEDPTFAATGVFGTTQILPLREAVQSYAMTPLLFEPGSRWQYSNAGINTAGRIIEVVSGMPYEQFLAERLFRPLGMNDTTFSPTKRQLSRLAKGYRAKSGKAGEAGLEETSIPLFASADHPLTGNRNLAQPAGGLFSTAADVARFGQMLLQGGIYKGKRLLSEAAVREMTTRQAETNDGQGYGLGWFVNPDGSFGHNGAFSTMLTVDRKHRLVKVFLVQFLRTPDSGNEIDRAYQTFDQAVARRF